MVTSSTLLTWASCVGSNAPRSAIFPGWGMTFPWTSRKRIDTTCRTFIIRPTQGPTTSRASNRPSYGIWRSGRTVSSTVPRITSNSPARAAATESVRAWRVVLTFMSSVRFESFFFARRYLYLLTFDFITVHLFCEIVERTKIFLFRIIKENFLNLRAKLCEYKKTSDLILFLTYLLQI